MLLKKVYADQVIEVLVKRKETVDYQKITTEIDPNNITEKDLKKLTTFFKKHDFVYKPTLTRSKTWSFHLPAVFLYCFFLLKLGRQKDVLDIAETIGLKNFENEKVDLDILTEVITRQGLPTYAEFLAEYPLKIVGWYYSPELEERPEQDFKKFPNPEDDLLRDCYKLFYVIKLEHLQKQGFSILEEYLYTCFKIINNG